MYVRVSYLRVPLKMLLLFRTWFLRQQLVTVILNNPVYHLIAVLCGLAYLRQQLVTVILNNRKPRPACVYHLIAVLCGLSYLRRQLVTVLLNNRKPRPAFVYHLIAVLCGLAYGVGDLCNRDMRWGGVRLACSFGSCFWLFCLIALYSESVYVCVLSCVCVFCLVCVSFVLCV